MNSKDKITIIGLGYVGLPLAVEFAKKYHVIGFDINETRIAELRQGKDKTLEVEDEDLKSVLINNIDGEKGLFISSNPADLESSNIYIVTVPTPTDDLHKPILTPLIKAS